MNFAELSSDARYLGVSRALMRSVYYRANRLWGVRIYQLMAMEPADVARELVERNVPYECRILDAAEALELATDPENGMDRASVTRTLAKGDVCFGILDDGVLASCGWYTNVACTVLEELTVTFDRRYLYMYGGYTRPSYRGENLHGVGLARACIALCARGFPGIVTLAERVNFASLRSAHRVGFRDYGIAFAVGKGDRLRIWQTRMRAQYALRVEPSIAVQGERERSGDATSISSGNVRGHES